MWWSWIFLIRSWGVLYFFSIKFNLSFIHLYWQTLSSTMPLFLLITNEKPKSVRTKSLDFVIIRFRKCKSPYKILLAYNVYTICAICSVHLTTCSLLKSIFVFVRWPLLAVWILSCLVWVQRQLWNSFPLMSFSTRILTFSSSKDSINLPMYGLSGNILYA